MRGHIRKRGKDSYSIKVSLGKDSATGKYMYQWVTVKGSKALAEKRLTELLHEIENGAFIKPAKTSFADYLRRWIEDYVRPNLSPRTAEGYESIVNRHLIPALGHFTLPQLRPEQLQRYYSEKLSTGRCDGTGGLSKTTVLHHHTCLHRALRMAMQWGLIARNPADAVTAPRAERAEMATMSEVAIAELLHAAEGTPYHAVFHAALYTGMRRSELLALRWSDVDLDLGEVRVTRSLHQLKGGAIVFRPPKSAKGRRTVSLPPSAILRLRELKARQSELRALVGTPLTEDSLIFSSLEGRPLRPNSVTRAWSTISRRTGLVGVRLHDARHTHASLMLKHGIHPKIVQERLGHATIAVTLDTYSHVAPGLQQAAAKAFDQILLPRNQDNGIGSD